MKTPNLIGVATLILGFGVAVGFGIERELTHKAGVQLEGRRVCSQLASEYIRPMMNDDSSTSIDHVDYSPVRNSCIAALTTSTSFPNGDVDERWLVVDLLTHEELMGKSCLMRSDCGNGNDLKAMSDQEETFDKAIGFKKH